MRTIANGQIVEILLVKSFSDATVRLQGTLRTFGLLDKHTHERVTIANHAHSTPDALHKLRHLVALRVLEEKERPPRPRITSQGIALRVLEMTTYSASGGTSALYNVGGWPVRAEAHQGSFAIVWPARASLGELLRWLDDHGARGDVLLGYRSAAPVIRTWHDALAAVAQAANLEDFSFAGVDLEDLVITWSPGLRQLPTSKSSQPACEIGAGAERFDGDFVAALVKATAVDAVASEARTVAIEAAKLLGEIPHGAVSLAS